MADTAPKSSRFGLLRWFGFREVADVPDAPVWQLWVELQAQMPMWRFLLGGIVTGPQQKSGFDALRKLRLDKGSAKVAARVESVSAPMLDELVTLAKLNADRQGYFARSILLAYITIPFTIGAIVAEIAPAETLQVLLDHRSFWGGALAGIGVAVVARLMRDAQARQFLLLLEMLKVERSAAVSAADAPQTPPAHPDTAGA